MDNQATRSSLKGIAIIGMAGRFPGAKNTDKFWQNLCNGVESISFFTDEELVASGVESTLLGDPNYIKAGAVIDDIEMFDAQFFGFPPREAEVMDPQHRLFLECAWEALENAGYNPEADKGVTGVYAGGNLSSYLLNNLISNRDLIKSLGVELTTIGNDKDYIPTRVSYKLNLHGPSLNVSTACSTSLVAVHLGCRGLLSYECDLVLAGGITIQVPQKAGYFYQQGGITSPDGHCRAFDASARGTTFGNGMGIVVLKRLEDALRDGDCIHAVIKGSAINNDGSLKVGYMAPSVDGQAAVIAESQALAGFIPETITYIEAHGTGTALGDPIEIRALETVFRASTEKNSFCGIGSVKTNVGHLNSAAGVTSLIKTVLALKHKLIPPSLHFETPNSQIDFANSPFYVNTKLCEWKTNGTPRRAGVSSFGIGGTNAHVVLEEAPTVEPSGKSRPWQLLLLSAKTNSALDKATLNLAEHLEQHQDLNLADVAYTLSLGRRAFKHRRLLVCREIEQAKNALSTLEPNQVLTQIQEPGERPIAFMFSGQGAQYVNMAEELYQSEPTFQEQVDICCELLKPHLELDLRLVLYPNLEQLAEASGQLQQTAITQPALFVIEYALAQLWMEWGVRPTVMMGHSIGEYVAATLAGVLSLADALALVAARGKLMQELPSGSMLAVPLPETEVQPLLGQTLSLAAINGPSSCVVSGVTEAVDALENRLASQGVACRRLHTSHAFHSQMMEPILETFTQQVQQLSLKAPQIPYLSNVTGTWISAQEATAPSYWAAHLRQTVRFEAGLQALLQEPSQILLEIGPGRTLATLAKQHPNKQTEQVVLASLRHPHEAGSDMAFLLNTLAQLWLNGLQVDWSGFYTHERRHRLPLPTYPFERKRYWIEPAKPGRDNRSTSLPSKKSDLADWFYIPLWKQSVPLVPIKQEELESQKTCTLVFIDECGLGSNLVNRLEKAGQDVITVQVSSEFSQLSERQYTLKPQQDNGYDILLKELLAQQKRPDRIVHLWSVTPVTQAESGLAGVGPQEIGFYSLLFLAQALGKHNLSQALQITVVSSNMQSVTGEELLSPEKATLLGPVKVIPQEYPNISCRSIDVVLPASGSWQEEKLTDQLLTELRSPTSEQVIAYRGNHRWLQTFEPVRVDASLKQTPRLSKGGVYLITGGLGGIGLVLAEHLAKTVQAKLILIGRSVFPAREEWENWLHTHDETDNISGKIGKVRELEELGAEVLVISADVANLAQMQVVVARAQERFGSINGVIHAAGVPGGGVIQLKTPEDAQKILTPKVNGTLVLDAVLKDIELDFLVVCSSITSILGGFGQVDYTGANQFLNAFAQYKHSTDGTFAVSINWDAWQEVGMAVEAVKQLEGISDLPDPQSKEEAHPLFERCLIDDSEQETYISKLSVDKHWVLSEHKVIGEATLPGTSYLEMVRAASESHRRDRVLEFRDINFLAPLVVKENEEKEVRTLLKKWGDGFEFVIMSQSSSEAEHWREHAVGKIAYVEARAPKKYDLQEIESKCNQEEIIITEQEPGTQPKPLELGARWNSLRQIKLGIDRGLAFLELPEVFADDIIAYKLHPALLDKATGFLASQFLDEGTYLPFSYKRLRFKAEYLPAKIYSYITYVNNNQSANSNLAFNVTILDDKGTELVEIEEYTLRRLNQGRTSSSTANSSVNSDLLEKNATPTNEFPADLLIEGLLSSEGIEVFSRVLNSRLSQVVVSISNLLARAKRENTYKAPSFLEALERANLSKPAHPRPALNNAYVAPRNETEQMLANIWQEMLGIKQVGIHDNFFELGGDSLLAVRFMSQVRDKFQIELAINNLFEAPTVAAISECIETVRSTTKSLQEPVGAASDDREEGEL